jgi:radical SAM protein with 4Fe4S-binding SPASM domain
VVPPERHVFERDGRFLISDPVGFVWFVTDAAGRAVIDALAEKGRTEDSAAALAQLWQIREDDPRVASYVDSLCSQLVKIGFLHFDTYKPRDWGANVSLKPTILYLHLTNRCNLKCPYCYNQEHRHELIQVGRQHRKEEDLIQIGGQHKGVEGLSTEPKTEKMLAVLDEAYALGFRTLKLTGGEALLNKDAMKIARHAKKLGMYINLLTNAVLITPSLASEIAEAVDCVSVSLDSDVAEEHDVVRGAGTHAQVLNSIGLLKKAGVKYLHLNAVITAVNLHSVKRFLNYAWNTLKADEVTIAGSAINVDDPTGKWGAGNYVINGDQYRQVYDQQHEFEVEQEASRKDKTLVSTMKMFRRHCGVGTGLMSIDPNGDIYPCQTLHRPEFLIGNAFEPGALTRLIETSPVMRRVRSATVDLLPECKTCPVRYVCSGGCRSEAYTREGDFLARNRELCPTFFKSAVDRLWASANVPSNESESALEQFRAAKAASHACCE